MADISIQFHALPEELVSFVKEIVEQFKLHVVGMRFGPFSVKCFNRNRIEELFSDLSSYRRICFTLAQPLLPADHELDFAAKNPNHLRLDIGRKTDGGLEQSWLSARTDDPVTHALWKKIAKRLEKLTYKGVTAVNVQTGARAYIRSFRYTAGAKALEDAGTPMYPPQGPAGPRLELGADDADKSK